MHACICESGKKNLNGEHTETRGWEDIMERWPTFIWPRLLHSYALLCPTTC